jgi:hypothetical protein
MMTFFSNANDEPRCASAGKAATRGGTPAAPGAPFSSQLHAALDMRERGVGKPLGAERREKSSWPGGAGPDFDR